MLLVACTNERAAYVDAVNCAAAVGAFDAARATQGSYDANGKNAVSQIQTKFLERSLYEGKKLQISPEVVSKDVQQAYDKWIAEVIASRGDKKVLEKIASSNRACLERL